MGEDLGSTVAEEIFEDLLDEMIISLSLQVHRSIKLKFFDLDDLFDLPHQSPAQPPEFVICRQPYVDVFGVAINGRRPMECECPSCGRVVAATRLAPHLEKCMGLGRNSSRIASRKMQMSSAAGGSVQDCDGARFYNIVVSDESSCGGPPAATLFAGADRKRKKRRAPPGGSSSKSAKRKALSAAQKTLAAINVVPEYIALDASRREKVLAELCGVVQSGGGGDRMCVNDLGSCPLHSDSQRAALRRQVLAVSPGPSAMQRSVFYPPPATTQSVGGGGSSRSTPDLLSCSPPVPPVLFDPELGPPVVFDHVRPTPPPPPSAWDAHSTHSTQSTDSGGSNKDPRPAAGCSTKKKSGSASKKSKKKRPISEL